MALAESFRELWKSARGLRSRPMAPSPPVALVDKPVPLETPLLTSKQLPAHENTAPLIGAKAKIQFDQLSRVVYRALHNLIFARALGLFGRVRLSWCGYRVNGAIEVFDVGNR